MTKYKFVKFSPRFILGGNYLSLRKTAMNISKAAFEALGSPKKVDVYFDEENKAIQIIESETGRIVGANKSSRILSINLGRIMPLGRYYFADTNVFIFDE